MAAPRISPSPDRSRQPFGSSERSRAPVPAATWVSKSGRALEGRDMRWRLWSSMLRGLSWLLVLAAMAALVLTVPDPADAQAQPSKKAPSGSKKAKSKKAKGKKAKGKKAKGKKPKKTKKAKGKKKSKKKKSKKKKSKKAKGKKPSGGKKKPKRPRRRGCPSDMVRVFGRFCIDRYEAYTIEMLPRGKLRRSSPFKPVTGKKVKAANRRGRMPQAYISRNQAAEACQNAGKRLCTDTEWVTACKGKRPTLYPYGKKWEPGRCNDSGVSSFAKLFGPGNGQPPPKSAYTWDNLNDPRLNRPKGTCAPAGRFKRCRNSFKIYDMVGNLHEWTAARGGTFRGGYFLDTQINGKGCEYKTSAHRPDYHDYSTGFRCCLSVVR